MIISERQKNILETIVREYINSAKPVSSQYLEGKYDFEVCPATIRNEMQKLTDGGYLCQPYTSAGRIPTDKGYRFFVDKLMDRDKKLSGGLDFDISKDIDEEFADIFRLANSLTRDLASASSSLVLGYLKPDDIFWKEGWEDLLQNPEFSEKALIPNFIDYLGYLEDNVKSYKPDEKLDIFIGAENNFSKSCDFTAITFVCQPSDKAEMIISIVGPKRMPYERNIALINDVIKLFEQELHN